MNMAAGQTSRLWFTAAAVAVGGLLFAACGDDDSAGDTGSDDTTAEPDAADDIDLDGREFVSSEVEGYDLVAGSEIRLTFDGGEIGIQAGCNNMGGTYTLSNGELVADQLAMTEMACEEPLMNQDAWVAGLVGEGVQVTLDEDTLVLAGESGTITATDREVAEPDMTLEGTVWIVDGLVSGDAVSTTIADTSPTMVIEDGTATLDTGCNTGTGAVEIGSDTLTFGPIALTLMACPQEVMDQETMILTVLEGEVDYVIESNRLSVINASGDDVIGLEFIAAG